MYGLRWEITPPGGAAPGSTFTSIDVWNGPSSAVRQINGIAGFLNLSNWQMHYTQIAPRFGLAYRLKKPDLLLRAGGGLFYDDAIQSLIHPVSLSPLNTWQFPAFAK